MTSRTFRPGAALVAAWLLAIPAGAATTKVFEMIPRQAVPEGELDQAVYVSRGHLALGPTRVSTAVAGKEIWDSFAGEDGTTWYVTGSPAALHRLPPPRPVQDALQPGVPSTLFEAPEIAFTAMVRAADGAFVVTTLPAGKIYRVTPEGEGKLYTSLPSPLLWCAVAGKDGAIYVGGGPEGVIYRLRPGDPPQVETYFDTRDQHVLAMAWGPDGNLWASTSGRGGLYRIEGPGRGRLVTTFTGQEVKAMAFLDDVLVLGVNHTTSDGAAPPGDAASTKAIDFSHAGHELVEEFDGKEVLQGVDGAIDLPGGLDPAAYRPPDGATVVLLHPDERQETVLTLDVGFVLDLATDGKGRVYLALGGEGQVRQLEKDGQWQLLARAQGGMVSTLATRAGGLAFAGSSNPASFMQVLPDRPASAGRFTGDPLDAGVLSRWGHLDALFEGELDFETRSGNTMRPDSTWSEWAAIGAGSPGMIQSPAARYLQVRSLWKHDLTARLTELSAYYLNQNQKPRIDSFEIADPAATAPPAPDVSGLPKDENLDKILEIGKKDEAAPASTDPAAGTPATPESTGPTTTVELTWTASDQDGDSLVHRLWYRTFEGSPWLPITPKDPLETTTHSWQTDSVPDGRYLLKIQSTDERANPPGKSLTAERELGPVLVDNSRPRVEGLTLRDKNQVTGTASDETSPVRKLEFQVDGQEWLPFGAKDGLLDSKREDLVLDLPVLSPGAHVLAVRATDAKGNVGTALLVLDGGPGR